MITFNYCPDDGSLRRFLPPLIAVCLVLAAPLTALARIIPPPPAEIVKTLTDIGDLELVRALQPLQLTAAQIETLLLPMKQVLDGGEKERKTDYDALRALSADVTKARDAALKGDPIPTDLDEKIRKASEASADRFLAVKKAAVSKIYNMALVTLSDAQKEEVVRQVTKMLDGRRPIPTEFKDKPNLAPKDKIQEAALGVYTERILILERVPEILAKMKPAILPPAEAVKPGAAAKP